MCPGRGPAEYTEAHLRLLTDVELVRQHPGMYIGSGDSRGLHELLFSLVTDSLQEMMQVRGRALSVTLHADNSVEIADDRNPVFGELSLEAVFTQWHGLGPSANGLYWGTYLATNALSAELNVRVRTDGSVYQHTFRRGVTHAVLQSGGPSDDRGLTIRFRPDPLIFGELQFDSGMIRDILRQYAFLHSGVRISFTDESTGTHDELEFTDGIRAYVQLLNTDHKPIHPDVIVIRGEQAGIDYEVGLQWCSDRIDDEVMFAFTNGVQNPGGGTHQIGAQTAVKQVISDLVRKRPGNGNSINGDDARNGLTTITSVRLSNPQFLSNWNYRLTNPEAGHVVTAAVSRFLRDYFRANPEVAERIIHNAIEAQNRREAEREARKRTQ